MSRETKAFLSGYAIMSALYLLALLAMVGPFLVALLSYCWDRLPPEGAGSDEVRERFAARGRSD